MRLASDFAEWLIRTATHERTVADLHRLFCERLVELGLPLWRSSLALEVLDPEFDGPQIRWIAHEASTRLMPRGSDYGGSPGRIVDETRMPYRRRLDAPVDDMSLLEDLRQMGATDYYITPLHFLDPQRTAHISFATLKPEGFTASDIAALEEAALLFGPCAERYVLRGIAIDLLTTYVGRRSAARIYDGAVERGRPEMITATILIADLRGFTHYSETQPMANVLDTLNDFFDALVAAIDPMGGEVLKFIGDALFAIFPANEKDALPYAATLAAALEARRKIATLNATRQGAGEFPIKFGLALGAGEIAYGNIGSRKRLDFTAIGPAVNQTSRLLEIAKKLDRDIVISKAFATGSALPFESLGVHELRDIAGAQEIFSVA
jgi:adenylate cyclase